MPPKATQTLDVAPKPAEAVDLKQAAADAFTANPKAEEFHQTSDGQCFTVKSDAKNHAKRLGDNEVKKVTPASPEAAEETPAA